MKDVAHAHPGESDNLWAAGEDLGEEDGRAVLLLLLAQLGGFRCWPLHEIGEAH